MHRRRFVAGALGILTAGCSGMRAPSGSRRTGELLELKETVGGAERLAHLYVPSGYDPDRPAPLLLGAHGAGAGARSMYEDFGWARACEARGWLGVFPESGVEDVGERLSDDNAFWLALVRGIHGDYAVDRGRIRGVGFSAGAHRLYAFSAQHSGWITALAVASGVVRFADEAPSVVDPRLHDAKPVSILHLHGGLDRRVPMAGGTVSTSGRTVLAVQEGLEMWIDHMRCANHVKEEVLPPGARAGARLVTHRWTSGDGMVQIAIDPKLAHAWPKDYGTTFLADFLHEAPARG